MYNTNGGVDAGGLNMWFIYVAIFVITMMFGLMAVVHNFKRKNIWLSVCSGIQIFCLLQLHDLCNPTESFIPKICLMVAVLMLNVIIRGMKSEKAPIIISVCATFFLGAMIRYISLLNF